VTCDALRELRWRAENNTAKASPLSPAGVKWGSWFLAKRSLNVRSGAARRVSWDRLHARSPRLGWLPPSAARPRHCRDAGVSRHQTWGGQGGCSRPEQGFTCLKILSSADRLLGKVSCKRQPAFRKSQRMIQTQRFPQIISSCRFPSGAGSQPRKCQGPLQRAQAICPLMNSASSR